MAKELTELVFPKEPWISQNEYDDFKAFGVYNDESGKKLFNEYQSRAQYQIWIITNHNIGKFHNGTIADGYLDPTDEIDNTAYLTHYQQDWLKLATASLIEAQRSGWRPYNDLKASFTVQQGPTNSTIGSFEYATEMQQLPYLTQMSLRTLMLDVMINNPAYKLTLAPEEFVKIAQLVDFNSMITDTQFTSIGLENQLSLNAYFKHTIDAIIAGSGQTNLIPLSNPNIEMITPVVGAKQSLANQQFVDAIKLNSAVIDQLLTLLKVNLLSQHKISSDPVGITFIGENALDLSNGANWSLPNEDDIFEVVPEEDIDLNSNKGWRLKTGETITDTNEITIPHQITATAGLILAGDEAQLWFRTYTNQTDFLAKTNPIATLQGVKFVLPVNDDFEIFQASLVTYVPLKSGEVELYPNGIWIEPYFDITGGAFEAGLLGLDDGSYTFFRISKQAIEIEVKSTVSHTTDDRASLIANQPLERTLDDMDIQNAQQDTDIKELNKGQGFSENFKITALINLEQDILVVDELMSFDFGRFVIEPNSLWQRYEDPLEPDAGRILFLNGTPDIKAKLTFFGIINYFVNNLSSMDGTKLVVRGFDTAQEALDNVLGVGVDLDLITLTNQTSAGNFTEEYEVDFLGGILKPFLRIGILNETQGGLDIQVRVNTVINSNYEGNNATQEWVESELVNKLSIDGTNEMEGILNNGGHRIINVSNPINETDVVIKVYADANYESKEIIDTLKTITDFSIDTATLLHPITDYKYLIIKYSIVSEGEDIEYHQILYPELLTFPFLNPVGISVTSVSYLVNYITPTSISNLISLQPLFTKLIIEGRK